MVSEIWEHNLGADSTVYFNVDNNSQLPLHVFLSTGLIIDIWLLGDNNHRSWSKCLGLNHLSSLLMVLSADKASRLRFLLPDKSWMGKMESDMLQKENYLPEGEIIKHWWFLLIQLPSIQLHLPPYSYVFCLSGQLQLILLLLQHAAIFQASSCHRTLQRNERKGRLCCRSEEQIVVWIVIRNGS